MNSIFTSVGLTRPYLACRGVGLILVATLACGTPLRGDPISRREKAGPVACQAFADREGITPGETFHLAVVFTPDKDHHIYWQNPGGLTGLPTEVDWSAPEGFKFGRLRYPVPHAHYEKALDETSFIYEGATALLTPVRVPATAKPGTEVAFRAQARWLVCRATQCVPGNVELSLKLPVVETGKAVKPANQKVFEEARRSWPEPPQEARHVKLSGAIDREVVKPGETFTATLAVEIEAGHHMQSNKPLEGLIPAVVFVEQADGFKIGEVEYPPAKVRQDPVLGKLSEFDGKLAIKIPVEVAGEADTRPRWIRGVMQYQICSDAGTCFRPQRVEFAIPVQMAGGPKPTEEDEFADGPAKTKDLGGAGEDAAPAQQADVFSQFQQWLIGFGFGGVIIAGFLGGFLLNLMPCVLPVISLKVLSFVRQAHDDRWRVFRMGLAYSAGIMIFYGVLAVLFFVWHQGWGEIFQSPRFVIIMAAFILAFSLSLFGVFTLFAPKVVNELGAKVEAQEGYFSAFATGILATLLGTACTAPFLSAAIGYAAQRSPLEGLCIFLAAGLGMASPFIVLTYNPAWLRFLPKPGEWMRTFEAIMGFLLLGTVIWLLNPLRGQLGAYGLLLTLIFLLAVAIAVWIRGKIGHDATTQRKIALYAIAAIVLAIGWILPFRMMSTIDSLVERHIAEENHKADGQLLNDLLKDMGRELEERLIPRVDWSGEDIPWQQYWRARAMLAVEFGYTVFVDYTADWCASCKTNLKTSIEREETIKVMRELNVIPYEADYTIKRPEITEDLRRFGRAGVPMYLVFKPGDTENPEVLPELLTPQLVIDALRRAGPSQPKSRTAIAPAAAQPAAPSPVDTAAPAKATAADEKGLDENDEADKDSNSHD